MKKFTQYLPVALSVVIGVLMFIISHNPIALGLWAFIGYSAFYYRAKALGDIEKFLYVAGAGATAAVAVKGIFLGIWGGVAIAALMSAFCTSVLFSRMKV
jgi:hypothetical protein